MHARALARAITAVLAIGIGATLTSATPSYAADVDPQAPVVVNDSISLWPYEAKQINVLANDTDPTGDELSVCWLPQEVGPAVPRAVVADASPMGAPAGTLLVMALSQSSGTFTVDYSVCSHTRVTPATLTVTIRTAAPVVVEKVEDHPGRLRVTNENGQDIRFWYGSPRAARADGKITIPAHGTRVVRVQRHTIQWIALIGHRGLAGHGRVRDIELDGPALPTPHHGGLGSGGKGGGGTLGTMRAWAR
ncbi:Ig-like domain-containing protein [Nocardioides sp. CN2-186]|uniref:Ig-like domain-containing protein n=1 Tax=Nocardioides tweenelious TaxID=3156607 RepID=UPI0032B59A2D